MPYSDVSVLNKVYFYRPISDFSYKYATYNGESKIVPTVFYLSCMPPFIDKHQTRCTGKNCDKIIDYDNGGIYPITVAVSFCKDEFDFTEVKYPNTFIRVKVTPKNNKGLEN